MTRSCPTHLAPLALTLALIVLGCAPDSAPPPDAAVDAERADAPGADLGRDAAAPDMAPPDAAVAPDQKPVEAAAADAGGTAEIVTCRFLGSTSFQLCGSSAGHSCTGTTSCTVKVTGVAGLKLSWKSTCGGGTAYTIVDGKDETADFQCTPPKDAGPPPDLGLVKEVVTCTFSGSSALHKCSSSAGGCAGALACQAQVSAPAGTKLTWVSSCSGSPTTVVDGKNETVTFSCAAVDGGAADGGAVTEVVTCRFVGSTSLQSCYSAGFTCSGINSCGVSVSGASGTAMTWKSSCGGYAYTTLDGKDEPATFSCP